VTKHYARMRIGKQLLEVLSLNPSTTGQTVVAIAPRRGPADIGALTTGTTAGMSYTNVISQSGVRQFASWESGMIDMTSCVAGGSGAAQNEFDLNLGNGTNAISTSAIVRSVVSGVVPSTFTVSGNSAANTARGTAIHAIVCHWFVDLLDYVGGNADQNPDGLSGRVARSVFGRAFECKADAAFGDGKSRGDPKSHEPLPSADEKRWWQPARLRGILTDPPGGSAAAAGSPETTVIRDEKSVTDDLAAISDGFRRFQEENLRKKNALLVELETVKAIKASQRTAVASAVEVLSTDDLVVVDRPGGGAKGVENNAGSKGPR